MKCFILCTKRVSNYSNIYLINYCRSRPSLFHASIMHFNFDVCLSFVNCGQILIVPFNFLFILHLVKTSGQSMKSK